jgi:hypothetical protein
MVSRPDYIAGENAGVLDRYQQKKANEPGNPFGDVYALRRASIHDRRRRRSRVSVTLVQATGRRVFDFL